MRKPKPKRVTTPQERDKDRLQTVLDELQAARDHLALIAAHIQRIEALPTWPAVPSESWEPRQFPRAEEGEGAVLVPMPDTRPFYLTLMFPRTNGGYGGPNGKRKLYVGRDPQKVAEARARAERRRQVLALQPALQRLERWLQTMETNIAYLYAECTDWPRCPPELLSERDEG